MVILQVIEEVEMTSQKQIFKLLNKRNMKSITQFLLITIIAFSLQACGGGEKNNGTKDSSSTTTDNSTASTDTTAKTTDNTSEDKTSTTETKDSTTAETKNAGDPEKNGIVERTLTGVWEQKASMTKFTFGPEANKCKYEDPVTMVEGKFRVENEKTLIIEGTNQDADGDKNYKSVYKIIEITEAAPYKLTIEKDGVKMTFELTKSFGG